MKDIHKIQREILIKLLFSQGSKFTELKTDNEMENSQLVFHLDMLKDAGYVQKVDDLYKLTTVGKEFANRHDSDSGGYKKQAKISVWVAIMRGDDEFLVGTRLKSPFYGAQGFLAGKLDYGESIYAGTKREMKEETNLEGSPELVHIRHYINRDSKTDEIIEDKFFYFFVVKNPTGELVSSEEASFDWIKRGEFNEKITKPFESFEVFLDDISLIDNFDGNITFEERENYPDNF